MTQWYKKPSDLEGQMLSPFGPVIYQGRMSQETVDKTNECIDKVKDDLSLDLVSQLAGRVELQRSLQENIDHSCMNEILDHVENFSVQMGMPFTQDDFQIQGLWANVQQQYEYNPIHYHDGHVSGVGYLKVPKFITKNKKKPSTDGTIDFINGSKMFLNESIYNHQPKVGDVLLFPNYLMHTAYPFSSSGERRSFSFNLEIDKNVANVFSK